MHSPPAPISQNKYKSIRKLKHRKHRIAENVLLCEGHRLLHSAVDAGIEISDILITEHYLHTSGRDTLIIEKLENSSSLHLCTEKQMQEISEEVTPAGILFVARKKFKSINEIPNCRAQWIIYLQNISDPGNLGTIIRSAMWFNLPVIMLSPDSVEPGNPKVVRASAGSIFTADIYKDIPADLMHREFTNRGYNCLATGASGTQSVYNWLPEQKGVLCLGSEAHGLTPDLLHLSTACIFIPGNNQVESLNLGVAAGIIFSKLSENSSHNYKVQEL
jgi:TrmH family RNA methyltransferase